MYDTPGLLHPYIMAMRLNNEERKMIEIRKELKPRTFRVKPPIDPERVAELGPWTERRIEVSGASWDVNSVDISVSGLGWYSLGLKGTATVALWTLEGIHVTERDAMILHRAQFLERPGFWLPIAIANAIGEETRKKNEKRKAEQRRREDHLLEEDLILEESTY
ncbi:hypothetical protein EJB05_44937 [Eragrostis curvula]|uniref:PilZ domain-containing protein n=1 Tax=Eragrostis curvula TaxID=38414 RepID=A0A5J9TJ59_9POAL|nr:hypothetical protein EJB05_44937 [Eragrostis curvula]